MQVFTRSSYVNVFRDAIKGFGEKLTDYPLVMARNEYQSFQVCLRSDGEFTIKSVSFTDLVGDGHRVAAQNITYNYVEYVYVPRNTTRIKTPVHALRTAPDWFPDPLSNNRSVYVPRKTTQPIWITVYVPAETPAGMYKGTVTAHTTQGNHSVGIALEVCAVTLPESRCAALDYMHHQQIVGTWWLPPEKDPINICYGYKRYSSDWWALVGDIAARMKAHRQNILYINIPQLLLDGGTEVDQSGKYTFRWSKLDEYIKFFMDRGVVKGLEGTHIAAIDYSIMHFTTFMLSRGDDGRMRIDMPVYNSPESENWLSQYLPALEMHIEEMGWLPIWYQHVADEAMNDAQLEQYLFYYNYVRKLAPKLIIGDPVTQIRFAKYMVDLGTDVQVPNQHVFDKNREVFKEAIDRGVRMYIYNCCSPGEQWINRYIDKPVWHMRTLGWLMYDWNVKGYLHWGYNFWSDWTIDEYLEISEEPVRGDHYTIYPDDFHAHKVRSSIRYEANRDAAQDFELLTILGRKDPVAAKALVESIATDSCDNYSKDINLMFRKRIELVRAAAKAADEAL